MIFIFVVNMAFVMAKKMSVRKVCNIFIPYVLILSPTYFCSEKTLLISYFNRERQLSTCHKKFFKNKEYKTFVLQNWNQLYRTTEVKFCLPPSPSPRVVNFAVSC